MSVLKQTARRGRTEENPRAALNDINAQTDASGAYLREAADDMKTRPAGMPAGRVLCISLRSFS